MSSSYSLMCCNPSVILMIHAARFALGGVYDTLFLYEI
jgi:hypothetical protein